MRGRSALALCERVSTLITRFSAGCRIRRDVFLFEGRLSQRTGKRLNQELEKIAHRAKLLLGQHVEYRMGLPALLCSIYFMFSLRR